MLLCWGSLMQGPCSWLREQVVQGFVLLHQVGEKRRLNAAPRTQPKVLKFGRNPPFCQQTCRRCIHGLNPFLDASSEEARQQPYVTPSLGLGALGTELDIPRDQEGWRISSSERNSNPTCPKPIQHAESSLLFY